MAKTKQPSVEQLQTEIERLKASLVEEKSRNRRLLGLPDDAPDSELIAPWSTEWMQREMDKCEITHGAVTQVYNQVVFKLIRQQDGHVYIRHHDGKLVRDKDYERIRFRLSKDSFFMLLELMEYAEREFGMDRKAIVDDLTNGEGINIRTSINNL